MEKPRTEIIYPSWSDVGIPGVLQDTLNDLDHGKLLTYIVEERVFHTENKVLYIYNCALCGSKHSITRNSEAYDQCCKCGGRQLFATPYWKNNQDSIKVSFRQEYISFKIVEQMEINHFLYFGKKEDNIFSLNWDFEGFKACFKGGSEVITAAPYTAIAKSALCCPYLWDGSFNWKLGKSIDRTSDINITHLIYQWVMKSYGKFIN